MLIPLVPGGDEVEILVDATVRSVAHVASVQFEQMASAALALAVLGDDLRRLAILNSKKPWTHSSLKLAQLKRALPDAHRDFPNWTGPIAESNPDCSGRAHIHPLQSCNMITPKPVV